MTAADQAAHRLASLRRHRARLLMERPVAQSSQVRVRAALAAVEGEIRALASALGAEPFPAPAPAATQTDDDPPPAQPARRRGRS